uniref:Uncharacterized protein n=1 Tax=Musa acuminata subsp. malaccensis TaxID=214687 RepID=A0A804KKS1_MUSAM
MYLGKNWILAEKKRFVLGLLNATGCFVWNLYKKYSFCSRYFFSSECVATERRLKLGWSALVLEFNSFEREAKEADYQTHLDFSFVALSVASPEMVLCEQRRQLSSRSFKTSILSSISR